MFLLRLSFVAIVTASCLLAAGQPVKQHTRQRFRIESAGGEPVAFATVQVSFPADSSHAQRRSADTSGVVSFDLSAGRKYLVRVSAVGYHSSSRNITAGTSDTAIVIRLDTLAGHLQGVVVTSRAPFMKQEDDRTIVDPEPLAAASTNAYEILEKTPGVFVDPDGNVYLSSMTPATIYINGREMKMSTSDVATMLKNLPPTAISRIEILRTPSAKYDASGTGGVVNIILRKGVKPGLTGSAIAGMQQGKYGNQFLSLNLNNNDGQKSSFLNLNYSRRNSFETIETNRLFATDSLLSQLAFTLYPGQSAFAGYGISDEWKRNWNVNFDAGASYNTFDNRTENESTIHLPATGDTLTSSLNRVSNNGFTLNTRTGIDFTKKLDTTGSQWDNDIFYSYNQNRSNQDYTTAYSIPFNYFSSGDGDGNNARHLFELKSDLKLKAAHRVIVETGAKYSLVSFQSKSNYFTGAGNSRKPDNSRTSTFHFSENINAFYAQGSKTFWKNLILKAGGRVENTNMDGHQSVPGDTSFVIHRTDFFPYVYLSKKVISIAGYELRSYLVYRRTISRPGYDQLNPFPRYVDQYLSEVGNPALRPQFTTNYEANISVDERPLLAVGYNKTSDIFTNVVYQADSTRSVAYRTFDNLGTNKEIYLRGLGAIPPGHRYFFVLGAQFNHNLYNGKYQDQPLVFEKDSWTFFTYHQLRIDRLSQFTLSGFVRFHGLQQFYELSRFGALNTSINRQLLNRKLVVTLSLNDIFYTNQNDFTIRQGGVNAFGNRRSDTRRFGLNLRYNFGIRKKEESNDMFNLESTEK